MKSANLEKKAVTFNSLDKKELQNVCGGTVVFGYNKNTQTFYIKRT